jgi:sortase (surface protein transpeptidase)
VRRTVAIASVTAGFALLVGAPAVSFAGRPAADVGADPATVLAETSEVLERRPPPAARSAPARDEPPADDERSAAAPAPAPEPVAPPDRLALPSLEVDAPVVEVGLLEDGSLEIPEDVSTVGWYGRGVAPGEPGTALLAGHVDARSQGPGALFELTRLDVGDTAKVTDREGVTTTWQVVGRRSYAKTEVPLADLVRPDGPPRLAVLTCGGDFDPATRSYEENVVALLEPA